VEAGCWFPLFSCPVEGCLFRRQGYEVEGRKALPSACRDAIEGSFVFERTES
jgi:hypothetical protein